MMFEIDSIFKTSIFKIFYMKIDINNNIKKLYILHHAIYSQALLRF